MKRKRKRKKKDVAIPFVRIGELLKQAEPGAEEMEKALIQVFRLPKELLILD